MVYSVAALGQDGGAAGSAPAPTSPGTMLSCLATSKSSEVAAEEVQSPMVAWTAPPLGHPGSSSIPVQIPMWASGLRKEEEEGGVMHIPTTPLFLFSTLGYRQGGRDSLSPTTQGHWFPRTPRCCNIHLSRWSLALHTLRSEALSLPGSPLHLRLSHCPSSPRAVSH